MNALIGPPELTDVHCDRHLCVRNGPTTLRSTVAAARSALESYDASLSNKHGQRLAIWRRSDIVPNEKLKVERGIGFEDIVFHIERGDLLDILEHPNPDRYTGRRIFVVQREDYVYLVPFVEDEHSVFLKTIIPSRKATKQYLGEESDHED
jgi:hypothetical protein